MLGWMQYSFFIRLLIEEVIMVLIMCAVNITLRPLTCWGEILSFILAILLLATSICLPIALTVFILKNKTDEAQRHKIGLKLGSVY